ncbi:MAG: signal peptide peptidase SppA [Dehalococcoidia bacterium]|nr:signal peptide peptidase SppA [Dehalococcoidia bacterium]
MFKTDGGLSFSGQMTGIAVSIAAGVTAAGVVRNLLQQNRPGVAVINVTGTIQGGDGPSRPLAAGGAFSGRIIKWLQKAQKDAMVRAVVMRVNSPGGEVTASDEIFNEILRTRNDFDKTVVASFGGLAASGGYYLASACDRIVSNRNTLTGSIGVLSVVPNLEELLQKLGVRANVFKSGALKDASMGIAPMSDEAKKVWQAMIDEAYQQFVNIVAEGRNIPVDKVRELADGRIYTGKQAKDLGLVDEFGDLPEAVNLAAKMADVPLPPRVIEYRMPRFLPMLMGNMSAGSDFSLESFLGLQRFPTLQYLYRG